MFVILLFSDYDTIHEKGMLICMDTFPTYEHSNRSISFESDIPISNTVAYPDEVSVAYVS